MRGQTKVALAAAAAATIGLLSTSTPSVAQSTPEVVTYQLAIGGVNLRVAQCIGIGTATEVIEHEQIDPRGQPVTVKVPGRHRHHDLVCTRGVTDDETLVEWQRQLLAGSSGARQDVDLVMYDYEGAEFARFRYVNAWPSELTYVDPSSTDGALLEVVTIVAERMERVS